MRKKLTNSKVLQFLSQPDDEAQRLTTRLANLCSSIARPPYERHQSTRIRNANHISGGVTENCLLELNYCNVHLRKLKCKRNTYEGPLT